MKKIKDIVIVGGGTAGLISSLVLKQLFPQYNIHLVKSKEIGIIGVGEGSTEHFQDFLDLVKIDHIELINETNATFKAGILFKDFNYPGHIYPHSVEGTINKSFYNTIEEYNLKILESDSLFALSPYFKNMVKHNSLAFLPNLNPTNQYHFDTFKLNEFLVKKCIERGIKIQDTIIKKVQQHKNGYIAYLITGENSIIKGDFFIDCSGFKRILSSELEVEWVSYSNYLPMNSAITLSTDLNLKKGIEPYTTSTSLKNGWAWKIPTQTYYGNGYVFSDKYIDSDNALNEFNKHLGLNAEKVAKDIKFDVGRVDKFWTKNCVSIGLAGSFTEPLEAQSIGFSIKQIIGVAKYLISWTIDDEGTSKIYNNTMNDSFENLVSFIQLHYLTERKDSEFWKEISIELTDFNQKTMRQSHSGYFLDNDWSNDDLLFNVPNFYQINYGLNKLIFPISLYIYPQIR
jgi:flavin-dependent dehydrogenase